MFFLFTSIVSFIYLLYFIFVTHSQVVLGDMAQQIITINFFISVDIDNYHHKCQIFISFIILMIII